MTAHPDPPHQSLTSDAAVLTQRLAEAGCVAAAEEADELLVCAGGNRSLLESLVARRVQGEPLAWLTGHAAFGDLVVRVGPGVYVPRWQSITLAQRAAARLPAGGTALDICTGSGAIAAALVAARPEARVMATDSDRLAVACARANGVDALRCDLFDSLPPALRGTVDVVTAVVPYVPSPALELLPPDVLRHEDPAHYDGGPDGTDVLVRVVMEAPHFLRPGGALLLEVGGDEAVLLDPVLEDNGFLHVTTWTDDEGDLRGLEATMAGTPRGSERVDPAMHR